MVILLIFYVFSIGFGQKRENYSQAFPVSNTCMHFFCHSSMLYFVWGRFLFCISSGIFNLILPHAQREFLFLLHCFRKGSILLLLSRNGLYSVRTVGLFWDCSVATSCRSPSAIKGICLTGSMCWEYEYFQWWQLRLNVFFTFLHFTREEVRKKSLFQALHLDFATLCHTPFLGPVNIWISKIFSSMQFVPRCWEEKMNLYWELKFQCPCMSDLWVTDPSFCILTFRLCDSWWWMWVLGAEDIFKGTDEKSFK